jgi:hypothetical protein
MNIIEEFKTGVTGVVTGVAIGAAIGAAYNSTNSNSTISTTTTTPPNKYTICNYSNSLFDCKEVETAPNGRFDIKSKLYDNSSDNISDNSSLVSKCKDLCKENQKCVSIFTDYGKNKSACTLFKRNKM